MNDAYKLLPHYTYKERLQWEGLWELIEGIPYAMSPSPVPRHQQLAAALRYELTLALKNSNCQECVAYDPVDYKITEDTILIPDILIVCKAISKAFLDFSPTLVVEILSPSSALKDRNTKYQLYQQQKVPYYIIVDPETETVEIYKLRDDGIYELQPFNKDYIFNLYSGCEIRVCLDIFL